jgi:hypothetical protein
MKIENSFIETFTKLIETIERIDKQSDSENLIIQISDLIIFHEFSKFNKKDILIFLEEYLIDSGKENFDLLNSIILRKIDSFLDFYNKNSVLLENFDINKSIKSSLNFYKISSEVQSKKTNETRNHLDKVISSLETLSFSNEKNSSKLKNLYQEERLLEERYKEMKIKSDRLYNVYRDNEIEKSKYIDINFEKIAIKLKSTQTEINNNYSYKKKHTKTSKKLIFKPEIFGMSHRIINEICDIHLSENNLKDIFSLSNSKNDKLKLKTSSNEKLYFIIRQLNDFILGGKKEKEAWSYYVIEQFKNVSKSTFKNKSNLVKNDADFKNQIIKDCKRLKDIYL